MQKLHFSLDIYVQKLHTSDKGGAIYGHDKDTEN